MFLDSGNIILDHTFYAQRQDYGGKIPAFSAESLSLHQGMATSGRWCHMTLPDHVILGFCRFLPNFLQNLSAFVRGWQLVAVGVT